MIKEIYSGFIRIHILYHAKKEEIFGVGIMEELKRHDYSVSPGTLYPILHNLEKKKYLSSRKEVVNGKMRKYYRTTKKGTTLLEKSKEKIRELFNEVLEKEI